MTGVHLLIFATVVAAAAPRLLPRAGWAYRSPRLGIAAWYAVLATVTLSVASAGILWLAPWQGPHSAACLAWRWCMGAAHGDFGVVGRTIAAVLVVSAAVLAARIALTVARVARTASARREQHRELLTVAGRRDLRLGATVVEHARPAAYTLAGRDRRVVVTTGALQVLAVDELAAVLAHERAHARGRHDLLIDGVRLLEAACPKVMLFSAARTQLARLVEIRADEVATTRHAPISLARALVAMACASTATPVGALAVSGGDAAERLHRLLTPPAPLRPVHRATLVTAIGTLATAPLALVIAAQFVPILAACPLGMP